MSKYTKSWGSRALRTFFVFQNRSTRIGSGMWEEVEKLCNTIYIAPLSFLSSPGAGSLSRGPLLLSQSLAELTDRPIRMARFFIQARRVVLIWYFKKH